MADAGSYFSIVALVILVQLTINLNSCSAATKPIHHPSGRNIRFIRTSCRSTRYPNVCFTTFSRYATRIRSGPRLLATTALSVAFNTTRSTTKKLKILSKLHRLKGRDAAALNDCVQQVGDSVDELRNSISEMSPPRRGSKDFRLRMSDIQTWVSAALTNDETCMGGFSAGKHMNKRNLKVRVRRQVLRVAHLTSIALYFVNRYVAVATH